MTGTEGSAPTPQAVPGRDARQSRYGAFADSVQSGALTHAAIWRALGGTWGLVEATAPGLVFIIVQTIWQHVGLSVVSCAVVIGVLAVVRVAMRSGSLQSVVVGACGAGIGLVFALLSNDASNAFVPGIIINTVYGVVIPLTVAVRWPITGLFLGAIQGDLSGWRSRRLLLRANAWASLVFAAPSWIRVAVMAPLLWSGAEVAVLGVVKIAIGLPLTGMSLLGCYLLLRPAYAFEAAQSAPDDAQPATDDAQG